MLTDCKVDAVPARMSKEAINALPLAQWDGAVSLIRSAEEAEAAAERLGRFDLLGFDTETRPAFRKGQKFAPSLVQLASEEEVVLVQAQRGHWLAPLVPLLENRDIVKVGVAPDFDLKNLRELHPFQPVGFVDLARMARDRGLRHHGLRGLAAAICGIRISKSTRTSNWAASELSPQQIRYAATDAWIGLEIYRRLLTWPLIAAPNERRSSPDDAG